MLNIVSFGARFCFLRYLKESNLLLTHSAFLFSKIVPGISDLEMIEDIAKIVNEAVKDKVQVNLIINNRAGSNAP